MKKEYPTLDVVSLAEAVRRRTMSPVELVTAALERIELLEPQINACTVVCADDALAAARRLERELASGVPGGPLCGVPVAIKDAIWVQGLPATMGTRALADFVPPEDAAAVRRLREAGAIVVAKTTNPPLCDAGYTESALYGVTRNPWRLDRTPGGSSGGSAAAVAAGYVPFALGTDMGGSIRGPSAFCGIAGLKPTHGLVARGPCFEEGRTLNAIGPMTRTVRDAALCLDVIAGPDAADNLSVPAPYEEDGPGESFRAAWTLELAGVQADAVVVAAFMAAIGRLETLGWRLEQSRPQLANTLGLHSTLVVGERGMTVALREKLLEPEARRILEEAAALTAAGYYQAQLDRASYTRALAEFFGEFDVLLTPTVCLPAFGAGTPRDARINGRPIDIGVDPWWENCLPANLTGCPAISVPIGLSDDGLPIGLQILAPRFRDRRCLAAASVIETARPWPLVAPLEGAAVPV